MALIVFGALLPAFPASLLPCESWPDASASRREVRAERHFHRVAHGGAVSQRYGSIGHTPPHQRFLCAATRAIQRVQRPAESVRRCFPTPSSPHSSTPKT